MAMREKVFIADDPTRIPKTMRQYLGPRRTGQAGYAVAATYAPAERWIKLVFPQNAATRERVVERLRFMGIEVEPEDLEGDGSWRRRILLLNVVEGFWEEYLRLERESGATVRAVRSFGRFVS